MHDPWLVGLAAGGLVAFGNGANDVSKGIATLVGGGVTSYRRAILWGTAWTAAGGLAAAGLAGAMVATFGSGLLAQGTSPAFAATLATILGAAAWVLLATRLGLPVSTTHALVGSLVGVAALAYGASGVRWGALGGKILAPLALSPLASLALTALVLGLPRRLAPGGQAGDDCVCAEIDTAIIPSRALPGAATAAALVPGAARFRFATGRADSCAAERPDALRLRLDHLHWLTSGATSFARAMNDAPKMAALILALSPVAGESPARWSFVFASVTLAMVAGSLAGGLRVTRVLSERVTPLDHQEGFLANLVTSGLVTTGAIAGLPMSTTHVSAGAIIGAGTQRRPMELNGGTIRDMVLAWVATLPAAAILGILAYGLVKALGV